MTQIVLQPDDIERRRRDRATQLALKDIPLMRFVGSAFLTLGVYLNNAYLARPGAPLHSWWGVALALFVYAVVSWAAVRIVLMDAPQWLRRVSQMPTLPVLASQSCLVPAPALRRALLPIAPPGA